MQQQHRDLKHGLDAGMNLGNHTFSHQSPNTLGAAGYIKDIARGDAVTRELLRKHHKPMRWFRHPYLETGTPEAVKREIDGWLAEHGYRIAPVTIDADDWEFAEPYDDAIARHDKPRRQKIRTEYLAYTEKTVGWYRQAAHALFGRGISYVMLLHASRLNADCIDELPGILQRNNLRAVTLDAAMQDPAYRIHDPYTGKDGIEWLERWSIELHKELPWDEYSEVPADIKAQYDKVDADQR